MGNDLLSWRITISVFHTNYRPHTNRPFTGIYLRTEKLSLRKCFHTACLIAILLVISGIEKNPGPITTRGTSSTSGEATSSESTLAITDTLSKILNELAGLRQEQVATNNKIDNLNKTVSERLDNLETNMQAHHHDLTTMKEIYGNLELKVNAMLAHGQEIASLHLEYSNLTTKVDALSNIGTTSTVTVSSATPRNHSPSSSTSKASHLDMNDLFSEMRNRDTRKTNIIISGLSLSASQTDVELVECIFSELRVIVTISSCKRFSSKRTSSRPPLLQVTLPSTTACSSVLRVAKNLRSSTNSLFSNVFINPDLTPAQREEQRLLNDERKARILAGEDVIIKHGKVVSRISQP